jgi:hypothetical protein
MIAKVINNPEWQVKFFLTLISIHNNSYHYTEFSQIDFATKMS